ncbi:transposase [Bradyrhizobium sp. CSA112]|uniref:transposase n=1 Tax=Bradyrhizobium sp. CSA112 TaxID=2699170 RepID=UPI0023AEFB2F|nr:transposase [Bradyrhizobium sp. CSA112]
MERALGAELSDHLGYEKGDPAGRGGGNSRNGTSAKTILTEDGEINIAVPRDRAGSFESLLIAKARTRFDGFDDKILSLYARGMTVREIQGIYLNFLGRGLAGFDQPGDRRVREWQSRPLDPVYPVAFFDALRVKIRVEGMVKNKAVYVARRVDCRHGPVRHSVRLAFSGISAMIKVSISPLIRRPEFGRSASSVKAGPAAPACGGYGLDRPCCRPLLATMASTTMSG